MLENMNINMIGENRIQNYGFYQKQDYMEKMQLTVEIYTRVKG